MGHRAAPSQVTCCHCGDMGSLGGLQSPFIPRGHRDRGPGPTLCLTGGPVGAPASGLPPPHPQGSRWRPGRGVCGGPGGPLGPQVDVAGGCVCGFETLPCHLLLTREKGGRGEMGYSFSHWLTALSPRPRSRRGGGGGAGGVPAVLECLTREDSRPRPHPLEGRWAGPSQWVLKAAGRRRGLNKHQATWCASP